MKKFSILGTLSLFILTAQSSTFTDLACKLPIKSLNKDLESLNKSTVSDTQIVTADDIKFCPGQSIKNAHLEPEDLPDDGSVWRVGNRRWNDDYEKKYQRWVKENLTNNFLLDLGLAADCADLAVTLRAIFSRIHNLPASFAGNTYSNTSKKYSATKSTVKTWSEKTWKDDFKKDKRFQRALKDWMVGTGTVNLHSDTYPVNPYTKDFKSASSCVTSGALQYYQTHVSILQVDIEKNSDALEISSTMPADIRLLREAFYSFLENEPISTPQRPDRGLVWWNWVVNCKGRFRKVEDKKMPYYGRQQYEIWDKGIEVEDINDLLIKSLNLSESELNKMKEKQLKKLLEVLEADIKSREKVVNDSLDACLIRGIDSADDCYYNTKKVDGGLILELDPVSGQIRCQNCPEINDGESEYHPLQETNIYDYHDGEFRAKSSSLSSFYYDHSTPSRDKRLVQTYQRFKRILSGFNPEQADLIKANLLERKMVIGDETISYYHILEAANEASISPQPWDSKSKRWGLHYAEYKKKKLQEQLSSDSSYKDYIQNKKILSGDLSNLSNEEKLRLESEISTYEEENYFFIRELEALGIKPE